MAFHSTSRLSRVSMCLTILLSFLYVASALVHPAQKPLQDALATDQSHIDIAEELSIPLDLGDSHATWVWETPAPAETLENLLNALSVMQDKYFVLWLGTWPSSIDWTAAVLGTQVVATLSSLTSSALDIMEVDQLHESASVALENTVNQFFSQTMTFYFGENAFSLRNQAYDDMLWVVLDWLENVKFQDLHTDLHYAPSKKSSGKKWYGTQFRDSAAHRSRIFYEIAAAGWDKKLCGGGMIWNPNLVPYKNAITNELYISASIGMYLYFPGDPIDAPFMQQDHGHRDQYPHNPTHLKAAVDAYSWLVQSNMTGIGGLYADGFHISNWSGSSNPGSKRCDLLNKMVYTYNQGVILSGLRGLWLATGSQNYLRDGHDLINKVLRATGWPKILSDKWSGLGRGGVLEEICDSHASCSQNGQTFKGIFFHHLAEFCRPLRPHEERFLAGEKRRLHAADDDWSEVFNRHMVRCSAYRFWIEHNARAALMTRDDEGRFGMWWGLQFNGTASEMIVNSSTVPADALDYRNDVNEVSTRDGAPRDFNDYGRGRTVETQSGGVAVLRALFQWQTSERV